MYARGILFGKMVLELGDTCVAKNEKNKMFADIEFKTKVCVIFSRSTGYYCLSPKRQQGFFSGTYNAVAGHIRRNTNEIGEVSGKWSSVLDLRLTKVNYRHYLRVESDIHLFSFSRQTGRRRVLFDVAKDGHKIAPKTVPPIEEQEPNESRRYVPVSPRF